MIASGALAAEDEGLPLPVPPRAARARTEERTAASAPVASAAAPRRTVGIATILGADVPQGREAVNRLIREADALEAQGKSDEALEALRRAVRENPEDAKARYFLGKVYAARAAATSSREDDRLALLHLNEAAERAKGSTHAEDAEWGRHARERLIERSRRAPVLDQYDSGSYPWGYCAPTSLRMALRLEGLADPGADAVALEGAAPYTPGSGSSGALVAVRARELGLTDARFSTTGSLTDVAESIGRGKPVLVGGDGWFAATLASGGRKERSYPAGHWLLATGVERDEKGSVSRITLNDPDGGHRLTMTRAEFEAFFGGAGSVYLVRYDHS